MSNVEKSDSKTPTAVIPEGVPEASALAALDQALQGVEALSAAVTLMEQAATSIVSATDKGISQIDTHVDTVVKERIDQLAASALTNAMLAFRKIEDLLDPFLALFRRGE